MNMLLFHLDDRRYALSLERVERVLRVVEITPLPYESKLVMGVISLYGRIVKVIDGRALFDLPAKEIALSDEFVVFGAGGELYALLVDGVEGVRDFPEALPAGQAVSSASGEEIFFVVDPERICREAKR